ncbi:unnamed protein product [Ceutorhynchus assimilis]|uniref:Uncharacterized protein n=1 Tax=Ceutorhynchus assimilis TaxID=467358 RepID=A0A9N9N3X2_9CUCU|nr:unnamed protein product [Ceutorhynchus assimilis]
MATSEPTISTTNSTSSHPWKFLGSVSSVSPVSFSQNDDSISTPKSIDNYNGTGYYIDDDAESVFNDLKTVLLACIATLVPLIITLATIFGIRTLWVQYKTRQKPSFDGVLVTENTTTTSKPLHSLLFYDKGSSETHLDISTSEAVEICDDLSPSSNNKSSNINGSIITMTLKNNHLIVETEERNDIEEDSRETTLRYSPSARDGVFVVEVQQGVRRSPGSEPNRSGSMSDQCALVHSPPEKYNHEVTAKERDSEYNVQKTSPFHRPGSKAKTGLSTSTTSLSSLRQSYSYSNQLSCDQDRYGYNLYMGYDNDSAAGRIVETTKPKITSALYKTNLKSLSFDVVENASEKLNRLRLGNKTSLDNVLESNGVEEFNTSLNKSRLLVENDSEQ